MNKPVLCSPPPMTRREFIRAGLSLSAGLGLAGCQSASTRLISAHPIYPIKSVPGQKWTADQKDRPFLIQGDTPWSLITGLTQSEAQQYLEDRAQKGFNALIVNLIEHRFNGPQTRSGLLPFTSPETLSGPVEEYFTHADWVIQKAAELEIVIFLAPVYLGYDNETDDDGWINEVLEAGVEGCRSWGQYVGQRYGKFDNLVWLIGGDRNPGIAADHVNAFVAGLKEFDNRHLFTAHPAPGNETMKRFSKGGWLTLNATYAYDTLPVYLRADYVRSRNADLPSILIESTYENEHNASPVHIRRQAYWAILFGATGQFFGNNPIWLFNPGWQQALDQPGSLDMARHYRLFTSRPWEKLVPDLDRSTLSDGTDDWTSDDTLAAAIASDGTALIAYLPSPRTVTVDLSRMSGSRVRAWWFNPRSGEADEIGVFHTKGAQEFQTPGDEDWVLVIDDVAVRFSKPGETVRG